MPNHSPQRPQRQPQAQPPPIDTALLGSAAFNSEPAGRCAQCHTRTTTRRVLRTTYVPPTLNHRELDYLSRGEDAYVGDHYFQRMARRQRRGDFGTEKRMVICADCALRWLIDCITHNPGLRDAPGARASGDVEAIYNARAMVAVALKRQIALHVGVTWRIERGLDGRSQVSLVAKSGGSLAPQQFIRQDELRRYGHAIGRSLFA